MRHPPSVQQKWVDEVEQEGWGWCSLCEQLAFEKERTVCAIGILHDFSSSGSYMLRREIGGHANKGRLQLRRSLRAGSIVANQPGDHGRSGQLELDAHD